MTAPVAEATAVALNLPLAEAVLEQITEHPELHNQRTWGWRRTCDTSHCIAGWTIAFTPGAEFVWDSDDVEVDAARLPGHPGAQEPDDVAQELLGITTEQAERLFYGSDAEAVDYLRELIAAARQVTA